MDDSISIRFGEPKHGWLPVYFRYKDFALDFEASDAVNDPLSELYDAIVTIHDSEPKQILWWLESMTYFFNIEKKGADIELIITEAEDFDVPDTKILGNEK